MKLAVRFATLGVAVAAATLMIAPAASAHPAHLAPPAHLSQPAHPRPAVPRHPGPPHSSAQGPVFVETDAVDGNSVVAYDRAADGTLSQAGVYPTGGIGGVLDGAVADHTASQGAVAYSDGLLYAVNAGSNTVTVFAVHGDQLRRVQVISSGGNFPVSITVHNNLVEVLNARDGGSVQGFIRRGPFLVSVPTWNRPLGLTGVFTPEFVGTPGQVTFTPDGSNVIVTTKANGNSIDVFNVTRSGALSATPVVTTVPGTLPFGVVFDPSGNLVVAEAGTNSVETFTLNADDTLTSLGRQLTGQGGTCWIVGSGSRFYASNTGPGSLTGYTDTDGTLVSLGNTATDAGTVDAAISSDGANLYAQTGIEGIIDEYTINSDGSLTQIGSITTPDAIGGEGIVAL